MTKAGFRTQKYRIAENFIFYIKLNEFPGILEGKMFRLTELDEGKEKLIDRLRS